MSLSENKINKKTVDIQTEDAIKQVKLFYLQPIESKRIEVSFSASHISSDGGLLLVNDIETQSGIIKALAKCIGDTRDQSYVDHSLEEIAAQRVY